jgi:hypothetical protein
LSLHRMDIKTQITIASSLKGMLPCSTLIIFAGNKRNWNFIISLEFQLCQV